MSEKKKNKIKNKPMSETKKKQKKTKQNFKKKRGRKCGHDHKPENHDSDGNMSNLFLPNHDMIEIKGKSGNKYFYNAKFERSFNNCNRHPNYRWHNNKMYIAIIGKDKKGHKHTSKQHFLPESTYRQPVLCNTCRKFIYYNTTAKPINDRCSHCKFCGYCLWRNRQNISKVIVQTFNI